MTIVKWAASTSWGGEPTKKEYVRETEHFYIKANKQRDSKISRYERYFDSEAEAAQFITDRNATRKRNKEIDQIKRHAVELLEALEALVLFTNPKPSNAVALHNAHRVIALAKGEA